MIICSIFNDVEAVGMGTRGAGGCAVSRLQENNAADGRIFVGKWRVDLL